MKKALLLLTALIVTLTYVDVSAYTIEPGYDPAAVEFAGLRLRDFKFPSTTQDIFIGRKPGVGGQFNFAGYTFQNSTSYNVKFTYTPSGSNNLKVLINNIEIKSFDIGNLGSSINYIKFRLQKNQSNTTLDFKNFKINNTINLGDFYGPALESIGVSEHQIKEIDLSAGFTIEGDIIVTGSTNTIPHNEINKIDIVVGSCVPTSNLIAYWPFDECNTPVCNNYAPGYENYVGLMAGSTISRIAGRVNACLKLDETNPPNGNKGLSYVDVGHVSHYNFNFATPFTIATWFKYDAATYGTNNDLGNIVSKMLPGLSGWSLGTGNYNDQVLTACKRSTTPNKGVNMGGIRLEMNDKYASESLIKDLYRGDTYLYGWGDDQWHFLVCTYSAASYDPSERAGNANDIVFYIDGVEVTGCPKTGNKLDILTNDARFRIGNRHSDPSGYRGYRGLLDEMYLFNKSLSSSEAYSLYLSQPAVDNNFNYSDYCGGIQEVSDLVLWLDPNHSLRPDGLEPAYSGETIRLVPDMANNPVAEDAVMDIVNRRPVYVKGGDGINYEPGVKFTANYQPNAYGHSDIMQSKYDKEITAIDENGVNKWNPSKQSKTLIAVFKAGADMQNPEAPYYSDGRQTICEFGGPLSGFNIYIASNGKICFGMWNRFEEKYINYTNDKADFYPIDPQDVIVAHLEFDGINNQFRAMVTKYNEIETDPVPSIASEWISFQGLSQDNTDWSGIGGSCRTRYYDYSTGETYSDHFNGVLGQVFLYNQIYTNDQLGDLYEILNNQYSLKMKVPVDFDKPNPREIWTYIEKLHNPESVTLSTAYPNPFTNKTSFSVYLPEEQNLSVELYNAIGQKVQSIFSGNLSKGIHDFVIDGNGLSDGMYIFRVSGDGFVESGKVVITK